MPKRKPPQGIFNFSEALEIRHVGQVKERLPGAHSEKILRRESQKITAIQLSTNSRCLKDDVLTKSGALEF